MKAFIRGIAIVATFVSALEASAKVTFENFDLTSFKVVSVAAPKGVAVPKGFEAVNFSASGKKISKCQGSSIRATNDKRTNLYSDRLYRNGNQLFVRSRSDEDRGSDSKVVEMVPIGTIDAKNQVSLAAGFKASGYLTHSRSEAFNPMNRDQNWDDCTVEIQGLVSGIDHVKGQAFDLAGHPVGLSEEGESPSTETQGH